MKKYIFFFSAVAVLFIACATKLHIGDFDLDAKPYNNSPRDTLAVLPFAAFSLGRRKYNYIQPGVLPEKDFVKVVTCQPDPLDHVLKYDSSCNHHSDIHVLLHLEKMKFSDPASMASYIHERFKDKPTPDPFKAFSDDDLFSSVKSRRIQTQDELNCWIDEISVRQDKIKADIKNEQERIKREELFKKAQEAASAAPAAPVE